MIGFDKVTVVGNALTFETLSQDISKSFVSLFGFPSVPGNVVTFGRLLQGVSKTFCD